MTAPGNTALVIGLMAVVVACAAYAIGRLHQRRQMDGDREDAYREGYDNATRRTFSLAAHLVARRRTARPGADPVADGPSPAEPASDPPASALPASALPASALPARALPASALPASGLPASGLPASALPASALPASASPAMPPRPPSEYNATSLGFPVPPPASPQIIGEPAAFGGVVYRPFLDPRLVGNSEPLPADRGPRHGVPSPRSHPSIPAAPEPATASTAATASPAERSSASAEGEPQSTGRHTVPDELVRSATYRLPADRVFRAKVPEPTDRPALPDEPTTRIGVPKPRQS